MNCEPILTIYIGDDVVSQQIALFKNDQPLDLTGVVQIEIDFPNDPDYVPPQPIFYQALKTNGQITVSGNPILGIIAITLAAAWTTYFQAQTLADMDVIVTDSAGHQQTYRAPNSLSVVQRNT